MRTIHLFLKLGVHFVGVLVIRAPLFGVLNWAPSLEAPTSISDVKLYYR